MKKISYRKMFGIITAAMVILWALAGSSPAAAASYDWNAVATGCNGKNALVGTLTSADYSQSKSVQDALWEEMKTVYKGLVDGDRLGNATKTYNCHSYIFNGGNGWLNDPSPYLGTSAGCWEPDAAGIVLSGAYHSCKVNKEGKCGSLFLMKRNELVYGAQMPTQAYKKK